MKRIAPLMHRLLPLAFAVAFFVPVLAHADCVYESPAPISPQGHVCGSVYRFGYNGYSFFTKPAGTSAVKICPAGTTANCWTTGTQSGTDAWGGPVQNFNFYRFALGFQGYYAFDFYAWGTSSADYWGSETKPILKNIVIGYTGYEGLGLYEPPRPLDPIAVYPSGSNVGNSYLVRWKSGRDLDRQPYSIKYEIWYKYWPFGSSEPPIYTLARADMPCHDNGSNTPDSNNECTTFIVGPQPAGNWKWYAVANLDASQWFYPGTITRTQSGSTSFTQPNP